MPSRRIGVIAPCAELMTPESVTREFWLWSVVRMLGYGVVVRVALKLMGLEMVKFRAIGELHGESLGGARSVVPEVNGACGIDC